MNICSDSQERGDPPAATLHLLWMNYALTGSGPLLSAVMLSAFALESLSRLTFEVACTAQDPDPGELAKRLSKWDRGSAESRLAGALRTAEAPPLDTPLSARVSGLIRFRNECAHDKPLMSTQDLRIVRHQRGKAVESDDDELYGGFLPQLHTSATPISPRHAMEAAEVHDAVLLHVASHGSETFRERLKEVIADAALGICQAKWFSDDDVQALIAAWDESLIPFSQSVTFAEKEEWYRELVRRFHMKPY